MSNEIKNKILKLCGDNTDLKLAIVAQPDNTQDKDKKWIPNPFFRSLHDNFGRVNVQVLELVEDGLSYSAGDFYVYSGRGGIKVHETPKGVRKQLQKIALKYGLSIVISDGVLYQNDRVSLTTDGRIDAVEIVKDPQTLVNGGTVIAPYAVVTVFKENNIIAKKFFVIPNSEYMAILKAGSSSSYPTMMAQKSVMKRVSNSIYSLLGVSLGKEESSDLDNMELRLIEDEVRSTQQPVQKQIDLFEGESDKIEHQKTTEVSLDDI